MRPDFEGTQETIEGDLESFQNISTLRIHIVMLEGVREWQKTNPNHTVKFTDVMGISRFVVDGEPINEMLGRAWGSYSFRRLSEVLEPLTEMDDWYGDVSEQANVTVEFEASALGK